MKKLLLSCFVAALISSATLAQVHIDKEINLNGTNASDRKITNLEDPTNAKDAANKEYVDAAVASVAAGGGSVPWTHFQTFSGSTSSGTWTVPTGVTLIKVQVWGGGGGGGSGSSSGNCCAFGGGGGAGGYAEGIYLVTAGTQYNVIVGAGGVGGVAPSANAGNAGAAGGTSSFVGTNINIAATGGSGGASVFNNVATGGVGGVGTGGNINTTLGAGGPGYMAYAFANATISVNADVAGAAKGYYGGAGGGVGGGNGALDSRTAGQGNNAIGNTGAGGGGSSSYSTTPKNGGNGADGTIVVNW